MTKQDRRIIALVGIVLALGNAFSLVQIRREQQQRFSEQRARQAAVAPALRELWCAQRADGDAHTAAVWARYLRLSGQEPPEKCP